MPRKIIPRGTAAARTALRTQTAQAVIMVVAICAVIGGLWLGQGYMHRWVAARYLNSAKQTLTEFKTIRQQSPSDVRLAKLAEQLEDQDEAAMLAMDKAKQRGVDIKHQVNELCDSLEAQMVELTAANQPGAAHSVNEIWQAAYTVKAGIAKAMEW